MHLVLLGLIIPLTALVVKFPNELEMFFGRTDYILLISTICGIIEYAGKELVALMTEAITVRVDNDVKEQAEKMLNDIGINMTAYIASSLEALVRERRVPFEMAATGYLTDQIILEKLAEAEREAADPNAEWLSHEQVFGPLREQYGYEV